MEDEDGRNFFKRCWSDGNILRKSSSPSSSTNVRQQNFSNMVLSERSDNISKAAFESSSRLFPSESDVAYSSYTPSISGKLLFGDVQSEQYPENYINIHERQDSSDCSNFVDLDWLSSSGNSCEEDVTDRSVLMNSPITGMSLENVMNGVVGDLAPSTSGYGSGMKGREQIETELTYETDSSVPEEFSDSFVRWVTYGETLCH